MTTDLITYLAGFIVGIVIFLTGVISYIFVRDYIRRRETSSGTCLIYDKPHKRIREGVIYFEPVDLPEFHRLPNKQEYISSQGTLLRELYVLRCLRALTPYERKNVLKALDLHP